MSSTIKLNGRYEIKEIIGEGGMGIVYRAFDLEMQSDVALKTIKELLDPQQIELFRRECAVLRKLRHPNVVDLYAFGISEDTEQKKPFFVMPLLPGVTLDRLIRSHSAPLTPDRVVDIITQTARGLQAAHDLELVHRDIKPSNIFVLPDDSVKLIDFGVVHLADQRSRTGLKGTLPYMSPEQLELKAPTEVSDVFSLAVVCYEALTRRRPFNGNTEYEIREAILHLTPPPISELNAAVSLALSQVVHAAMAKQLWNRTSTARQFAEELQKALHGQPIDRFDASRIEPRIARAQKALEASQYDFAAEILGELEAEGHIHPTIRSLRRQIDQALRANAVKQALASAQHRFTESEYQLALQKVDEVLRLEPGNEEALTLKSEIDNKHRTHQIENWFRLAQDHIQNYAYNHARQALQNVLRLKATNTQAIQMLAEVDRRENEYLREHREKEELYKSALEAWERGEVSAALSKLERVLELDRRAPDSASESAVSYQNLYNQVRSEHDGIKNAYEEARKLLDENDFSSASSICERVLNKFPEYALFQALKFDISERQRQHVSAYIVKVDREVEAEFDLHRKVAILSEAQRLYPEEAHFGERLDKVTRRRDLVAAITQKIRNLEERGQYPDALGQLEILRAIYPQYPGIDLEFDRISKRRDQQSKTDAKARWINQIDRSVSTGDFSHSLNLLKAALADFPDDAELLAQERLVRDGLDRCLEATKVFESALMLCAQGNVNGGLDGLWQAHRLDEHNPSIRAVLVETLLKRASAELEKDQTLSAQLVRQAIDLDPGSTLAKSLQRMVLDRQKDRAVDLVLSRSREIQAAGDLSASLQAVQKGLDSHPDEPRLSARREALLKLVSGASRPEEKQKDVIELGELKDRMREAQDVAALHSIMERSRVIARKYPGDRDVESVFRSMDDLWSTMIPVADDATEIPLQPEEPPASQEKPTLTAKLVNVTAVLKQSAQRLPAVLQSIPRKRLATLAATSIVIILLASTVALVRHRPPSPPKVLPIEAQVTINASVSGAHVLVDGKDRGIAPLTLVLAEGKHTIDAGLPGFESKGPMDFRVARGEKTPPSIHVDLTALRPVFRLFTELQQASIDGEKLKLDGISYETAGLSEGPHVVNFFTPVAGQITVEFELNSGQIPKVTKVESRQTLVVVLATLQEQGQLYSSLKSLKAGLNGRADQEVGELGVSLSSFVPGHNELVLDDGKTPHTEFVRVDPNPTLTILVEAQNTGVLQIAETQTIDASVLVWPEGLDSKKGSTSKKLQRGTTIFRLEPKTYHVNVSATGYDSEDRVVKISKGDAVTQTFTLRRSPTSATIEIKGAERDAEIYLDGRATGEFISPAGDYTSNQIVPGPHTIQLRKKDYEPGKVNELTFNPGSKVALSGLDISLTAFGALEFNVTPSSSEIRYRLVGETAFQTAKSGDKPRVKAGQYYITARATGHGGFEGDAYVVPPGRGIPVTINLVPNTTSNPPPDDVRSVGPEGVKGLKARKDGTLVCEQPYCLFQEKQPGTYSLKIKLDKGLIGLLTKKRARWVVNFVDARNYVEYEIDEKNLSYTTYLNGIKRDSKSVLHAINGSGDFYDLAITVGSNDITISNGGKRIAIPSPGNTNPLAGSFGFPKDTIVSPNFEFRESY